ncbi:MAG: hypothetical protein NTW62_02445 [Candidatus Nomurabacteria bacterium]|nr:hypothetical protein [Candidatus Nomurabacteria bacterium]
MKDKNKIFIKIFMALIFNAVFVGSFFYIYNNINTKNQNATDLTEQVKTESIRRGKISSLNSEIKSITREREKLQSHFAKSSDIVSFLDNLQSMATSVGATAEVSTLGLSKEGVGLDVEMKATGSFISLHKLLALLENSQYQLSFSSIRFDTTVSNNASGAIDTVTGKWSAVFDLTLLSFEN